MDVCIEKSLKLPPKLKGRQILAACFLGHRDFIHVAANNFIQEIDLVSGAIEAEALVPSNVTHFIHNALHNITIAAGEDGNFYVFDSSELTHISTAGTAKSAEKKLPLTCIATSAQGSLIFFGRSKTKEVFVLDVLNESKAPAKIDVHKKPVTAVACHATKPILASGSQDGSIHIMDLSSTILKATMEDDRGNHGPVNCLVFDGDTLFAGYEDGTVLTWDVNMFAIPKATRPGWGVPIRQLHVHGQSGVLIVVDDKRVVRALANPSLDVLGEASSPHGPRFVFHPFTCLSVSVGGPAQPMHLPILRIAPPPSATAPLPTPAAAWDQLTQTALYYDGASGTLRECTQPEFSSSTTVGTLLNSDKDRASHRILSLCVSRTRHVLIGHTRPTSKTELCFTLMPVPVTDLAPAKFVKGRSAVFAGPAHELILVLSVDGLKVAVHKADSTFGAEDQKSIINLPSPASALFSAPQGGVLYSFRDGTVSSGLPSSEFRPSAPSRFVASSPVLSAQSRAASTPGSDSLIGLVTARRTAILRWPNLDVISTHYDRNPSIATSTTSTANQGCVWIDSSFLWQATDHSIQALSPAGHHCVVANLVDPSPSLLLGATPQILVLASPAHVSKETFLFARPANLFEPLALSALSLASADQRTSELRSLFSSVNPHCHVSRSLITALSENGLADLAFALVCAHEEEYSWEEKVSLAAAAGRFDAAFGILMAEALNAPQPSPAALSLAPLATPASLDPHFARLAELAIKHGQYEIAAKCLARAGTPDAFWSLLRLLSSASGGKSSPALTSFVQACVDQRLPAHMIAAVATLAAHPVPQTPADARAKPRTIFELAPSSVSSLSTVGVRAPAVGSGVAWADLLSSAKPAPAPLASAFAPPFEAGLVGGGVAVAASSGRGGAAGSRSMASSHSASRVSMDSDSGSSARSSDKMPRSQSMMSSDSFSDHPTSSTSSLSHSHTMSGGFGGAATSGTGSGALSNAHSSTRDSIASSGGNSQDEFVVDAEGFLVRREDLNKAAAPSAASSASPKEDDDDPFGDNEEQTQAKPKFRIQIKMAPVEGESPAAPVPAPALKPIIGMGPPGAGGSSKKKAKVRVSGEGLSSSISMPALSAAAAGGTPPLQPSLVPPPISTPGLASPSSAPRLDDTGSQSSASSLPATPLASAAAPVLPPVPLPVPASPSPASPPPAIQVPSSPTAAPSSSDAPAKAAQDDDDDPWGDSEASAPKLPKIKFSIATTPSNAASAAPVDPNALKATVSSLKMGLPSAGGSKKKARVSAGSLTRSVTMDIPTDENSEGNGITRSVSSTDIPIDSGSASPPSS